MKIEPIITERLRLRNYTKDDALWAYRIWNDPEMGKYLMDPTKEDIDPEYLKMLESLEDDDECCYLIPVFKDSDERVGTCSFIYDGETGIFDIAYCVHKNFQKKGFATEMAKGMIEYARISGAKKVTIWVNEDNVPSNRVAAKCGGKIAGEKEFTKTGTDKVMKEFMYEIGL